MEPNNELLYLRVRCERLEAELEEERGKLAEALAKVVRQRRQMVVLARANQGLKKRLANNGEG